MNETTEQSETVERTAKAPFAAPDGSAWPDIGLDPLKCREAVDGSIEATRKRLEAAVSLQQSGVPDQTMLAWRIDVSRLLDELTVMTARWERSPNNPQNTEVRRAGPDATK